MLADSVRTLVANQLRAGADESRANAELAIARNQVSRAAQAADIARATLSEAIGAAGRTIEPAIGRLAMLPALDAVPPADVHSPASGARLADTGWAIVSGQPIDAATVAMGRELEPATDNRCVDRSAQIEELSEVTVQGVRRFGRSDATA